MMVLGGLRGEDVWMSGLRVGEGMGVFHFVRYEVLPPFWHFIFALRSHVKLVDSSYSFAIGFSFNNQLHSSKTLIRSVNGFTRGLCNSPIVLIHAAAGSPDADTFPFQYSLPGKAFPSHA